MRTIKINFVNQWDGPRHDWQHDLDYSLLCRHYNVEISEHPEYLFCGTHGHDDLRYNCVKIISTGENMIPDFSRFDYVMGFDYIDFGDRYLRIPLYVFYDEYNKLAPEFEKSNLPEKKKLLARDFCSFVVSNSKGADPIREHFFHELSKYKKVSSGGRFLNNVGGPVKNKLEFCSRYKFNIAIENSVSPGYVTEKIMQPLVVNSVPIYYGDPKVEEDFNIKCMVRIHNRDDVERAIQEIIKLDNDDDAYLEKCLAPRLVHEWDFYHKKREEFLLHIIDQPLDAARRTVDYGYQAAFRAKLYQLYRQDDFIKWPFRFIRSMMKKVM